MGYTVRFVNSIHAIGIENWKSLLQTDNPFLRFEFLAALENTHCIDQGSLHKPTGWAPYYAILESSSLETDNPNPILAIAPIYQKHNSYGEYVFDWAWADAYQQHGLQYYPKLSWCIPFTPSTGPRLVSQGSQQQQQEYYQAIAEALSIECQQKGFSGWHCLFPDQTGQVALKQVSNSQFTSMQRNSCQFHWYNLYSMDNKRETGYQDFNDYLATFTSRKRKNVNKERRRLLEAGFSFQRKTFDITAADIDSFYHCYQLTYAKRKMRGYLSREFFQTLVNTMPDQLLLVQAYYQDAPEQPFKIVANALYLKDSDNLYGRYWGCLEEFDSLHFECCYYQGIEYCIEHGLKHFDPGTQGEHKISRGFEPTLCSSQHWIKHPQFSQAIDNFLLEEEQHIQHYIEQANQRLPFKK